MSGHGVDRSGVAGGTGVADDAILESVIDAKGDLIAGTAANTAARLAVGTDGQVLSADSTVATGLKWIAGLVSSIFTTKGDILVATAASTPARMAVGSDGYALRPSSGATNGLAWIPQAAGYTLEGGYLDWTVAGSVLTIAVKSWAGNNPSDAEPVFIVFRSSTAATGLPLIRKLTAATTIAINDTALLGTTNSVAFRLWAVAFDDGGTVRLGVINCLSVTSIYPLAGFGIASSTQEDNAADAAHVFYTDGAAVASKAYATLGYATWETGLGTAGTWSAAPTRKQLFGPGVPLPGQTIQVQRNDSAAVGSGTTRIPTDNTIPQITEGDQYMTQAITPASAANLLEIDAQAVVSDSVANCISGALFQDAIADALKSVFVDTYTGTARCIHTLKHLMRAASTSSLTFRYRAGGVSAGTTTFNGDAGNQKHGGVMNSFMQARELMA